MYRIHDAWSNVMQRALQWHSWILILNNILVATRAHTPTTEPIERKNDESRSRISASSEKNELAKNVHQQQFPLSWDHSAKSIGIFRRPNIHQSMRFQSIAAEKKHFYIPRSSDWIWCQIQYVAFGTLAFRASLRQIDWWSWPRYRGPQ